MVRAVTDQSIRRTSSPGWYIQTLPASRSGDQSEVVALQHPVELALDGELQRPQRGGQLGVTDLTTLERRRVDRCRVVGA